MPTQGHCAAGRGGTERGDWCRMLDSLGDMTEGKGAEQTAERCWESTAATSAACCLATPRTRRHRAPPPHLGRSLRSSPAPPRRLRCRWGRCTPRAARRRGSPSRWCPASGARSNRGAASVGQAARPKLLMPREPQGRAVVGGALRCTVVRACVGACICIHTTDSNQPPSHLELVVHEARKSVGVIGHCAVRSGDWL